MHFYKLRRGQEHGTKSEGIHYRIFKSCITFNFIGHYDDGGICKS